MKDSLKGAFGGAEFNKTADICEGNGIFGGSAKVINLGEVAACLTGAQREKFVSGFNMKEFARIFEDESMMTTAETFLPWGEKRGSICAISIWRSPLKYCTKCI